MRRSQTTHSTKARQRKAVNKARKAKAWKKAVAEYANGYAQQHLKASKQIGISPSHGMLALQRAAAAMAILAAQKKQPF